MNAVKKIFILGAAVAAAGCTRTETVSLIPGSAVPLDGNKIVISNIQGIPDGVTFDKVKVEITGIDWQVIDVIEAEYLEGKATLTLPESIAREKLCQSVRADAFDYAGFWPAEQADNPNDAKVAGFSGNNITAYKDDVRVGRVYLTNGNIAQAELTHYVYYHYSDQPFTLSGYNLVGNNNQRSYKYEASFEAGWNAYVNIKSQASTITLTTTDIPDDLYLRWRFE